jgi:hypothetical protein
MSNIIPLTDVLIINFITNFHLCSLVLHVLLSVVVGCDVLVWGVVLLLRNAEWACVMPMDL